MKILILEPYYTGSHKQWAEGYIRNIVIMRQDSFNEGAILEMENAWWRSHTR